METTDSAKYFTTFKLFQYYHLDNADSALNYIDQCLLIAGKNNCKISEADCLQDKGYELTRLGSQKLPESFFMHILTVMPISSMVILHPKNHFFGTGKSSITKIKSCRAIL
jgi:hypothetical protein